MAHVKVEYTYQDYLALGDEKRYEILKGELIVVPAPLTYHQIVSREIFFLITRHVRDGGLGEVLAAPCDVVLSETNVVQPDILFVSRDRLSIIGEKAVEGAPDLVVEILSPTSVERDRGPKAKIYAEAGVREYWIVDPDARAVEVHRPGEGGFTLDAACTGDDIVQGNVLTGLRFAAGEVFPPS